KHPAGPERVTASNDASKLTPDAAAEEGKSTTPSEDKPAPGTAKPQQSAKLEKPQSDNETDKNDATDVEENAADNSAKPAATKERAVPAPAPVDNSQLEEAQKYLQGRGVPQDCNRGVSLLRSAASRPNRKARSQMAAIHVS